MKIRLIFTIAIILGIALTSCDFPAHVGTIQKEILEELNVPKALIINGDDFGLMDAVNSGITNSLYGKGGIVSSVSIQSTLDKTKFNRVIKLIKLNPSMDIGVHVTLVSSNGMKVSPVSKREDVSSLIDPATGFFYETNEALYANMDLLEVETEVRAQIQRVLDIDDNIEISHINSHFGTLDFWSSIKKENELQILYLDIASDYAVPIRWFWDYRDRKVTSRGIITATSAFKTITDTELNAADIDRMYESKKQKFISMLNSLKNGIIEIYCHPADKIIDKHAWRTLDYRLVTDPDVIKLVNNMVNKGELAVIGYKTLKAKM